MSATASTSPMATIFSGQTCAGFVLRRGRQGFESFDADLNSRGMFDTEDAAIAALLAKEEAP